MDNKKKKEFYFDTVWIIDLTEDDLWLDLKHLEIGAEVEEAVMETNPENVLETLGRITDPAEVPELILLAVVYPAANALEFIVKFNRLPDVVKDNCIVLPMSSFYAYTGDRTVMEMESYPFVGGIIDRPPVAREVMEHLEEMKKSRARD